MMTTITRVYYRTAVVPTRQTRKRFKLMMRYPRPLWYHLLRFAFRNRQQ